MGWLTTGLKWHVASAIAIVLPPAWLPAPLSSPRVENETTIVAFAVTDGLT